MHKTHEVKLQNNKKTPLSKSFCFDKHSSLRSLSFNFNISSSDNCDTDKVEEHYNLIRVANLAMWQ